MTVISEQEKVAPEVNIELRQQIEDMGFSANKYVAGPNDHACSQTEEHASDDGDFKCCCWQVKQHSVLS